MKEYKEEANFNRCLGKLSLEDVPMAIHRAKAIMKRAERDGYHPVQFKEYEYYIHNPSLHICCASTRNDMLRCMFLIPLRFLLLEQHQQRLPFLRC